MKLKIKTGRYGDQKKQSKYNYNTKKKIIIQKRRKIFPWWNVIFVMKI